VDPRAGLCYIEKWKFLTLPGLELRPLSRPGLASRYTDRAIAALGVDNELKIIVIYTKNLRLSGLVVKVPGYRSRGPGSIPGATKFSEN
jgi:hypothetical protein